VATGTLTDAERRRTLAVQLECALLAARQAARTTGNPGPLPALRILAHANPGAIDPDALDGNWGRAWHRFADMVRIVHGRVPEDPRDFVAHAPLPAVDAYVDLVDGEAEPSWWSGRTPDERKYLARRTRELPRLVDAATSGDITVLDRLEELLPADNAAVLRRARACAAAGMCPCDLYDDRGLWLLMLRLWAPAGLVTPNAGAFHRWAAFRRAYDLTLARCYDLAWAQVCAFPALSRPATRLQKEVENLRAYLTVVRAQDGESLRQAMGILRGIRGHRTASGNYQMIRHQFSLTINERGPFENPYLVLGVEHGTPTDTWKQVWRRARAESGDDIDRLSLVNEAKDRIMALERDGTGPVFVVPLDGDMLAPHAERPPVHLPHGPCPNGTRDSLSQAVDELREEALRELLGTLPGEKR
jgi:hypothetical protein